MTVTSQDTRPQAILVRDLGFRYPGSATDALQGVSLSVATGSCFGLLGPNGAGKTTLLSILTGILPLQAGQVVIDGHPIADSRHIKQLCALVPQDYAFYAALSGRENLDCFAGLYGLRGTEKRRRIDFAVGIASLESVLDRPAASYSGGVKRRLNLAIGLLNRPHILYLDEPTVGIDAQSRHFILESIARLQQDGMTVVYTSHYMEEIQAVCDALAVIDHGRLLLQDSLERLLARDTGQVVLASLDRAPDAAQRRQLAGLGTLEIEGQQLRIRHRPDCSLDQLLQVIGQSGLQVRQLQYGVSRLEDIYLSITRHALRD